MCIHVCTATGQHFRARLRKKGARRYIFTFLGPRRKKEIDAHRDAVREWSKGGYAEGDVALCADWYDPTPLIIFREATRKDIG